MMDAWTLAKLRTSSDPKEETYQHATGVVLR